MTNKEARIKLGAYEDHLASEGKLTDEIAGEIKEECDAIRQQPDEDDHGYCPHSLDPPCPHCGC